MNSKIALPIFIKEICALVHEVSMNLCDYNDIIWLAKSVKQRIQVERRKRNRLRKERLPRYLNEYLQFVRQ